MGVFLVLKILMQCHESSRMTHFVSGALVLFLFSAGKRLRTRCEGPIERERSHNLLCNTRGSLLYYHRVLASYYGSR